MRVLIDECVDRRLGRELGSHFVRTVQQQRWSGMADGRLLFRAQDEFDVLVTTDRNLPRQNRVADYRIAVIVLSARSNRLGDLLELVPALLARIEKAKPGEVVELRAGPAA